MNNKQQPSIAEL